MCIIHLLWCMLIEIAFTRSVGGPHPHSLFMNKHITFAFTQQACRQSASQASSPSFLCHAEFAHNSGFYLLQEQLNATVHSKYGSTLALAVAEASPTPRKNQWLLHICIKLCVLGWSAIRSFWSFLNESWCVHVCSLGCFLLFNIAYTHHHLIRMWVSACVCMCESLRVATFPRK